MRLSFQLPNKAKDCILLKERQKTQRILQKQIYCRQKQIYCRQKLYELSNGDCICQVTYNYHLSRTEITYIYMHMFCFGNVDIYVAEWRFRRNNGTAVGLHRIFILLYAYAYQRAYINQIYIGYAVKLYLSLHQSCSHAA